jgi:hypothetical protein
MKLFDPTLHVPITNNPWSAEKALTAANSIFDFLCKGREENGMWPTHPDEDGKLPFHKSIYYGAAGTLWALQELSRRLNRPLPFDPLAAIEKIAQHYLEAPDTGAVVPSFMLGETGILMLFEKISPSKKNRERIRTHIRNNIQNPALEALWGSPGTMNAALRLNEVELYLESAKYLMDQCHPQDGLFAWTQDLYGHTRQFTGAGHGFFGNAFALLEGAEFLTKPDRDKLNAWVIKSVCGLAKRHDGLANWHPYFGAFPDKFPPVQWCHGAPGLVTSLRSFPKDFSAEIETLLLEAGELIWKAGPLEDIGLCHGRDGNGYALLRMFARTGNEFWLTSARKFAMTAIEQRNGRYTLWTGEAGLALFLLDCIEGQADFPTLDYF